MLAPRGCSGGAGGRQAGLGVPVAPPVPAGVTPGSPHAAPRARAVVTPRSPNAAPQGATTPRSPHMAPRSWGSRRPRVPAGSWDCHHPKKPSPACGTPTQTFVTPRSLHVAPWAVTTPRSPHMAPCSGCSPCSRLSPPRGPRTRHPMPGQLSPQCPHTWHPRLPPPQSPCPCHPGPAITPRSPGCCGVTGTPGPDLLLPQPGKNEPWKRQEAGPGAKPSVLVTFSSHPLFPPNLDRIFHLISHLDID